MAERQNVRLGLYAYGFIPFSPYETSYSIYELLPLDMFMITLYMFSSCVILGPINPKNKTDDHLQPLIDELEILWDVEVDTYDVLC